MIPFQRRLWILAPLWLVGACLTYLALGTWSAGLCALAGAVDALFIYELSVVAAARMWSRASVKLPPRAFAGENAQIFVCISALRFAAGWARHVELELDWRGHRGVGEHLETVATDWRNGTVRAVLKVDSLRRGVYALDSVRVRAGDVFGLISVERRLAAEGKLVVYPALVPVDEAVRALERWMRRQLAARRAADAVPTGGVVPHRPGDRLSVIHWPTSLRTHSLYARERAPEPMSWRVIPLIHPGDPPDLAERALSMAFSFVAHWQSRGDSVECLVGARGEEGVIVKRCRTAAEAGRALAEVDGSLGTAWPSASMHGEGCATVLVTAADQAGRKCIAEMGRYTAVVSARDRRDSGGAEIAASHEGRRPSRGRL
ncbi:DUF58 domain-containing protein [Alicyclobacillus vulcanalis]|uniref:DUF58 domain-containing protein n=1 Tax=Alicyclobacillus vulcanalis TaxID=252246 RepID=A0A1N7P5J7_9BACL|nr:DUF58 domain-containing protein [Alicyclobacillus vulcanalis]SIT05892.1 Protein of unknown function DUF58 [Alicyclobacillus vulcanalis]